MFRSVFNQKWMVITSVVDHDVIGCIQSNHNKTDQPGQQPEAIIDI